MKLLITGANGQLGRALTAECEKQSIDVISPKRDELDITDRRAIQQQLTRHQPNIIVNTAAYTAVDNAETEIEQAYLINSNAPLLLASVCAELNIPLIHISTDYVFDGLATQPYTTQQPTSPQNVYGASKLLGEAAIAQVLPTHLIIRTAWLYSQYGKNFAKTILKLADSRPILSVVADQLGCPTYAPDLARAIIASAYKMLEPNWQKFGVYHFVGNETMTWFQFAEKIMVERDINQHKLNQTSLSIQLQAVSTTEYPTKAKRPRYSVLDCQTFWQDFELTIEQTSVSQAIQEILSSGFHN